MAGVSRAGHGADVQMYFSVPTPVEMPDWILDAVHGACLSTYLQ